MNRTRCLPLLYMSALSCAGPTSPFGAINRITKGESTAGYETTLGPLVNLDVPFETAAPDQHFRKDPSQPYIPSQRPSIEFFPDRQVIHRPSNIRMVIQSPDDIPPTPNLKLFYNDYDVTEALIANANVSISNDKKSMTFDFPRLTLPSDGFQNIKAYFQPGTDLETVVKKYQPPSCNLRENSPLIQLEGFAPPPAYLEYIEAATKTYNLNISLLTGLIAQESSFVPEAISWAKAIGLTQVATLAEREVAIEHLDWPRNLEIPENPPILVKAKIAAGSINLENEWRLDPERSITGGATYLNRIIAYWDLPQNKELLAQISGLDETEKLKIILASYHSGPARVGYAIKLLRSDWMSSTNLNEARPYVHRIISYCYHFSKEQLL